jgi:hypothetical protein
VKKYLKIIPKNMKNMKQILEEIDSKLSKEGFENCLQKTEKFMGQSPIKYLEEFNKTGYCKTPELLKYRVKHVLFAMSHITLESWKADFIEIFNPLLEILNN